ncbi:MAG: hypothetical protein GF344_12825 [Chitinivibrionales bacterium]|nr:hypothetical protein [Chitinivibrionales bacterium]MBD3357626.1 hypothetical protein [Chitinivibrionales bacterium]
MQADAFDRRRRDLYAGGTGRPAAEGGSGTVSLGSRGDSAARRRYRNHFWATTKGDDCPFRALTGNGPAAKPRVEKTV